MKNIYTRVAANIIWMFLVLILASFITDQIHPLLGDYICEGHQIKVHIINGLRSETTCSSNWMGTEGITWHWGFRHWMLMAMGVCLFIVNIVRVADIVDKNINS